MNFYVLISKIISNLSIFILFTIILILIRKHFEEFVFEIEKSISERKLFLKVKSCNSPRVSLGEKIIINNKLSVGNKVGVDVFVEGDEIFEIYFKNVDNGVILESFDKLEFIKVNGEILKERRKLNVNDEISVSGILFEFIEE